MSENVEINIDKIENVQVEAGVNSINNTEIAINSDITGLSDYFTKEETLEILEDYPTKTNVKNTLNSYYTKTESNSLVKNTLKYNYIWKANIDQIFDLSNRYAGSLATLQNDSNIGTVVLVQSSASSGGTVSYNTNKYTIDGADGNLSIRDCLVWLKRWVRITVFEAKASTIVNPDGKYSPTGGVTGLMSSTDKAYLTDLINNYWNLKKMPLFSDDQYMVNWLRETGVWIGGMKPDCGNHPPVTNNNQTSWVTIVFNGIKTEAGANYNNHRVQIAIDIPNSLIYMRRGWISSNDWTDWVLLNKNYDDTQLKKRVSDIEETFPMITQLINSFDEKINEFEQRIEELEARLNSEPNDEGEMNDSDV